MTKQITFLILFHFLFSSHSTKNKPGENNQSTDPDYLVTGYYYLSKASDKYQRQLSGTAKKYKLNPSPVITAENFKSATVDKNNSGNYYIRIDLDEPGGKKWSEGTGKAVGDSLAVIINNELVQVARVNVQITAPLTAINKQGLTKSQAEKYLADIKAKMKK